MHLDHAERATATDLRREASASPVVGHCPGCGGRHVPSHVAPHEYLTTSSGCWARFCEMLAWQYSDHRYWRAHDLMVDAYCLQHAAGPDPRAVGAAHVHLAGLHAQFTLRLSELEIAALRKALSRRGFDRPLVPRPQLTTEFRCSIEDLERHVESVRAYAHSVWSDWRDHHPFADDLCQFALSSLCGRKSS